MHKLDRPSVQQPASLAYYDYQKQNWDDLNPEHKQEIRQSLYQLQGDRCAYCEGALYGHGHIEHFRRKNPHHYPQLTFNWSNLFLSCDSQDHCGHYKDGPSAAAYSPDDLVKPDEHDPNHYFYFHSSGEIRIRSGISKDDQHRASETIRVFHLNDGPLVADRRRVLKQYQSREPDILSALAEFTPSDRMCFIVQEIEATKGEPHWAVIRHFFEKIH